MIRFTCDGREHALGPGEHFVRPREGGFRDTPASDLRSLIVEIENGRPWREAVAHRYETARPWLHRIISDPSRSAYLANLLPPGDGAVLDVGSGWGQAARPLARERRVVALEPVAERLAFIRAAARQDDLLGRMAFVEADYFQVEFEPRFAAIIAIGVLEWVGAFQEEHDPQERQRAFLLKTRTELAPDGCLLLGIENRLGLKYLLGCPDDHIGVPHVASLPASLARQRWATDGRHLRSFTYSQVELERLLLDAGFRSIEFHAAFPDYKFPEQIVPLADGHAKLNDWLKASRPPAEHDGHAGVTLPWDFQEMLAAQYRALAATAAAGPFVPSFFVCARP